MPYTGCNTLTSLAASCGAVKKMGGTHARVYVGHKSDITAITFGSDKEITAITINAGTLRKFEGLPDKNDARHELVVGENRNMFKHLLTMSLYHSTQTEQKAIESLLLDERMFVIIETNAGYLRAYGIDENPYKASDLGHERGMKPASGSGGEGVLKNDSTATVVSLDSNDMFNLPKYFKPGTATATNITALDALCA